MLDTMLQFLVNIEWYNLAQVFPAIVLIVFGHAIFQAIKKVF